MNIYWGDIHNHCGITYGFGSLENALHRAADHLDFCTITGHAMWPDMYERNDDTAFIVDFHNEGFQKLRDHWEEIRAAIAAANNGSFVTFQGYEMHSSKYGDHHLVSPSDELPLIYRDSPANLRRDVGVPAFTVAHHIGYPPGYRGIDWDLYDEETVPLIEVCSKHGCGMSETAPFPFYHNMGPRDGRNTVYEGLRRGFRFGFAGSTDHHAGYPGSYGDGKMAVLAESKTREAIWAAMLARRTYAVTGDRIACDFSVDGAPMGSILPAGSKHTLRWAVTGGYPIDKLVLYKNLQPIKVISGDELPATTGRGRYKFRVETGWGNNKAEAFRWDCSVHVSGGSLLSAEPCFRGRSILSPTNVQGENPGDVNNLDNRILSLGESECIWRCETVMNQSTLHPSTSSVILELEGDEATIVVVTINGHKLSLSLGELCRYGRTGEVKPWHAQAWKIHPAVPASLYTVSGELTDETGGENAFYHMEVAQKNGHWAFVTPVWCEDR